LICLLACSLFKIPTRERGWLVGLQLLALSLQGNPDPTTLLEEASGEQYYILDYLTEVVLGRQSQEVQAFLLSTCILERLTASLCDAVMGQTGSQQMLHQLEQTNLFVVSLDQRHEWYRYHALFAEALHYHLEQRQADLVPILHHRASLWYAQHDQTTQAILHALHAKAWDLVADLIERMRSQLSGFAWGISLRQLTVIHQYLKQLPPEIVSSRPLLCLACTKMLWTVASYPMLQAWLSTAETRLTASLTAHISEVLAPEELREQRNLLGSVIGFRAMLQSYQEHAEVALPLCQQVLSLVSADHVEARIHVALAQLWAYEYSVANDASAARESGLQAVALAQAVGEPTLIIGMIGILVTRLLGMGKLNEAQQLAQKAMQVGKQPGGHDLPHVSLLAFYQAEVLRERNHLDAALSLIEEAFFLGEQVESCVALGNIFLGYQILLRVYLSHGELDAACTAFRKLEDLGTSIEEPSLYLQMTADFGVIGQVRLWLACGELDRATRWVQELDLKEPRGSLFVRARQEEARVRVLLATDQPTLALQRLESVLQYCSNKNTSPIRDRKKGRKEDKEAVQMAYSSHHHNPERKDMPHGRNDSREWVARQGLPPDRYGIAARSDPTKPDRRAFGDLPDVGRTRAKNEYGDHRVLADCLACVSQLVST
jgi:LuxR family maltose regulon positive regulatory protein